jgi:hypothetical protein
MVSIRLCPIDTVQDHVLHVTIVDRGSPRAPRQRRGLARRRRSLRACAPIRGARRHIWRTAQGPGRACDQRGARARDEGEEHGR